MDSVLQDKRFARIATDRKFRGGGKKQRKVKIDQRFQSMFKEEKFVSKCTVDKRGRPKNFTSKENYRKYYDLKGSDESESDSDVDQSADDDDDDNVAGGSDVENAGTQQKSAEHETDSEEEEEETGPQIEPSIKAKLHNHSVDYARGEGNLYSDSSSDESSEDEEAQDEEEGFTKWGELDADAQRTEEVTSRLALCNMDWDRVGAQDIFLALSSFCPSTGSVKKVDIFLSDFGKERMKEEDSLGPQELRRRREEEAKDEEDYLDLIKSGKKAAKMEKAAMERVRQYQINRLKYYYAVVQFDSPESANSVYEECDGMEYELSATRFDLRFVPDDMEFDDPTSSCTTLPNPDQYTPKSFMTTALQQGKVDLTWDETDVNRQEQIKKAYDLLDDDLDDVDGVARNLIASSSDEEDQTQEKENQEDLSGSEAGDEDTISKYRALLNEVNHKDNQDTGHMQVTWDDTEENQLHQEQEEEEELTPWEKYLKKKKDKKKMKKEKKSAENNLEQTDDDDIPSDVDLDDPFFAEARQEEGLKLKQKKSNKKKDKNKKDKVKPTEDSGPTDLDLLVMDSDEEDKHFNYKTIVEQELTSKSKKKWRKKKKDKTPKETSTDNFDVDVTDQRFAAIFTQPEFNIDPSQQNFKKTKGMEKLIGEKQKRLNEGQSLGQSAATQPAKKSKLDPEISAALKSVKNKWDKNAKKKKHKN